MICEKCGAIIENGSAFCGNCGNKVEQQPYAYNPVQPPAQQNNAGNNTLVIVLSVIIGVLLVGVLAIFIMFQAGVLGGNKDDANQSDDAYSVNYVTEKPGSSTDTYYVPDSSMAYAPNFSAGSGDYVYPSDTQYITEAQLNRLSRDEVRLILNEIYARHGYAFQTDVYRNYFMSKTWYYPRYSENSQVEVYFNAIEKANTETIVEYEKRNGWR